METRFLANLKNGGEKAQTLANFSNPEEISKDFRNLVHNPVMCKEVMFYLRPKPGMVILDATAGVGGHSRMILEKLKDEGRLIGIDQDKNSLDVATQVLKKYGRSVELVKANFQDLDIVLKNLNIDRINGALFDLGVSSFQLSCSERGFSIKHNGPLDMRMDTSKKISAFDLVNYLSYEELYAILKKFGEERFTKRIVRGILKYREKSPIYTTSQLAQIIGNNIPYRYKRTKIHPATRSFQAIRIAVNRELQALEEGLYKIIDFLDKTARICVISFHSLEDRIVKNIFREFQKKNKINILTKKPLRPTQEEILENPRSRSAKIRVAEKL